MLYYFYSADSLSKKTAQCWQIIKSKLYELAKFIKFEYSDIKALVCVDTSPIMEKVWAQRAGLGWQGKHT